MSFNPDQPRDSNGRWAGGGDSGSSVGKSSGSGPRPVTRGPVQKLSSGHTDATQKTVEQARRYFAKEKAPKAVAQKPIAQSPERSGPHHIGDRASMVLPKAGEYYTVAGPKQRSGVFGNAYFRNTQVLETNGQHIGTLTTKWRGGRTESMTSTASGHSQGAGRAVMGHDVPWLLRTHWANFKGNSK